MAYIDKDGIEHVDVEIVDVIPPDPLPYIKPATPREAETARIKAPGPDSLFSRSKGGKKKLYQRPEDMQADIDNYFASCVRAVPNEYGEIEYYWVDAPTVPGLARALGMTMKTVLEYQKLDDFEPIITDAKLIIEEYTAKALHDNPKATGLIFVLKNMGWQDNRVVTYAPTNRLDAAKTPEQIAALIEQDIVD